MLVALVQAFIVGPPKGVVPEKYYVNISNPLIDTNGALLKAQALIGDIFLVSCPSHPDLPVD
jgi:hypothetical protein